MGAPAFHFWRRGGGREPGLRGKRQAGGADAGGVRTGVERDGRRRPLVLRASDGDERALMDVTVPEKIESNLPMTGIEKTFDGKGTNLGGQFQGFDLTNPSEPLIGLHRGGTIDDVWIY